MPERKESYEPLPRPYEVVLLAFYYFQPEANQEIRVDEASLFRIMKVARCPNDETARKILVAMVNAGLLQKVNSDPPSYARTPEGIDRTPPPPPGQLPRTVRDN